MSEFYRPLQSLLLDPCNKALPNTFRILLFEAHRFIGGRFSSILPLLCMGRQCYAILSFVIGNRSKVLTQACNFKLWYLTSSRLVLLLALIPWLLTSYPFSCPLQPFHSVQLILSVLFMFTQAFHPFRKFISQLDLLGLIVLLHFTMSLCLTQFTYGILDKHFEV